MLDAWTRWAASQAKRLEREARLFERVARMKSLSPEQRRKACELARLSREAAREVERVRALLGEDATK